MKGVILCGGKGTRLRPFTYAGAKQLIPIANKPIVYYALELMKRCSIDEVAVIVNHDDRAIAKAIGDGSKWGLQVSYIQQDAPRGLAHAIRCTRDFIGEEKFFVILGDNFVEEDLAPVVQRFAQVDRFGSMLFLARVDNPQDYGVVETEGEFITAFVEKPDNPKTKTIATGYYLLDPICFKLFDEGPIQASHRSGEYEITLLFEWLLKNHHLIGYHMLTKYWIDTGKSEDLLEANRKALLTCRTKIKGLYDEDSRIHGSVVLEAGSEVINSQIIGPVVIGRDCHIRDSYIGPFTSIYHNAVLNNCEIQNSLLLANVTITNIRPRIENSVIGGNVKLTTRDKRPTSLHLRLGDSSVVELP